MSEIKHARALLDLAEKDFKALQGMGDALTFADEVFGFHAQQAVEKTLRAWLAALGLEYPLNHNLARLLALLEKQGVGVDEFWDLTEYTAYAIEISLRRPGDGRGTPGPPRGHPATARTDASGLRNSGSGLRGEQLVNYPSLKGKLGKPGSTRESS